MTIFLFFRFETQSLFPVNRPHTDGVEAGTQTQTCSLPTQAPFHHPYSGKWGIPPVSYLLCRNYLSPLCEPQWDPRLRPEMTEQHASRCVHGEKEGWGGSGGPGRVRHNSAGGWTLRIFQKANYGKPSLASCLWPWALQPLASLHHTSEQCPLAPLSWPLGAWKKYMQQVAPWVRGQGVSRQHVVRTPGGLSGRWWAKAGGDHSDAASSPNSSGWHCPPHSADEEFAERRRPAHANVVCGASDLCLSFYKILRSQG